MHDRLPPKVICVFTTSLSHVSRYLAHRRAKKFQTKTASDRQGRYLKSIGQLPERTPESTRNWHTVACALSLDDSFALARNEDLFKTRRGLARFQLLDQLPDPQLERCQRQQSLNLDRD